MLTIKHYPDGMFPYVMRPPTNTERNRFISNGYEPPDLIRENKASVYQYARAELPPHYPVPAILGAVHITKHGVYIADPQGYDCLALWSRKYGERTI